MAEPAAPASTIGGIPPPDVPFPAGALPILRTYEFAQPVTSPIGFDDEIVVNHGVGLARVDVDTGEIITATLPSPDEVKAEVFYAVTDGSSYVAVLDVAGQGTIDTTVAIDPQTLRRTGRSERLGRRTNLPLFTSGPSPRLMLAKTSDGIVPFDPTTLEEGEPLLAGDFVDVRGHTDRGELWTWDRTGTVRVFDRAGTELASIELDRAIPMFGSAAVLVTATSVWIADGDHGSLVRIERDSKLPTHEMSLLDHYEWADVIRFRFSDRDAPFLIANVSVGDEGWWMLVGVDPETGELTSSHVIAPDTF